MYFFMIFNKISNALNPQHLSALIVQKEKNHIQYSAHSVSNMSFPHPCTIVYCRFIIPCWHSHPFVAPIFHRPCYCSSVFFKLLT